MVQKYQNEIAPIFYCGKKLKTSGKLLKIPVLQLPDWGQPYWMTRYIFFTGSERKSRRSHGGCHYIKSGCQEKLKKYVYFWYLGGVNQQVLVN